jgi:diguanylate cyclase (GGDEF)-like protein
VGTGVVGSASGAAHYRASLAKHEVPRALLWGGFVVLALGIVDAASRFPNLTVADPLHLGVVAVFWAGAWLAHRTATRDVLAPWIMAACCLVLVLELELEVWRNPTYLGLAYVLLGLFAFGPFTLDRVAMLTVAVPMLAGFIALNVRFDTGQPFNWIMAGVAALVVGLVLLQIRLNSLNRLYELTQDNLALSVRDPLTGVLNRRGLQERVPELLSIGRRHGSPAFLVFIDIDGLKAANDAHGHEFGDTVIRAVAECISVVVRAGDVVGRWGGDEFLVAGLGDPQPPEVLAERIRAALEDYGINLSKWPGQVSVGFAAESAQDAVFPALLDEADKDMYARRQRRREAGSGAALA